MNGETNGGAKSWQMQLVEDMGAVKEGVGTLKQQVGAIQEAMVRREDCQRHMAEIRGQVQSAIEEAEGAVEEAALKAETTARSEIEKLRGPSRSPTGAGHSAVSATPQATIAPSLWERVVKNSQGISAVVTMIVLIGGLLLGLSNFITRLEGAMRKSDDEQRRTQELVQRLAVVRRDAGATPR